MAPATPVSAVVVALAVAVVLAALPAASTAREEARQFKVGGPDGWIVPPPEVKEMYYANWASGITFYVGDSMEFVYKNDSVIQVDKAGYYHCTTDSGGGAAAPRDGSKAFLLYAPGYAYFASANGERCKMGERLMINVLDPDQPASAPGPAAPGPSSSASSVHAMALVAPPLAMALAGML